MVNPQSRQTAIAISTYIPRRDIPATCNLGGNNNLVARFALVQFTTCHPFPDIAFRIPLANDRTPLPSIAATWDGILHGGIDEINAATEYRLVHELIYFVPRRRIEVGRCPSLRAQTQLRYDDVRPVVEPLTYLTISFVGPPTPP